MIRAQHRTSSTEEAARGGPRVSVENERLQAFSLIALLVIVGGIVLARPLRLVSRNLGDALSLAALGGAARDHRHRRVVRRLREGTLT